MSSGGDTRQSVRTLPPERGLRARALDPRREWTAAALTFSSMLVPFGLGAMLGTLPHDTLLEPRAAWVLSLATCLAVAALIVQREAQARARFYPLAVLLVPLAHLARSGSPLFASLDACLYVSLATTVAMRAPYRFLVRHHASKVRQRFSAFAILISLLPGPLLTVTFGLASSIVIPAIARLLHPAPEPIGEEHAADFTTSDGLTLRATYWPGLPSAPAIVLVHGRHDGRDHMLAWARLLHERGAHVLAYDARAHGASDGVLTTFADREPDDLVHAAEHLIALSHAAPSDVALLGISMGGGAVLAALPALAPRGIHRAVLFAPASNYDVLVSRYLPPTPLRGLTRGIVWSVSHALGFLSPTELIPANALYEAGTVDVLVVHGRADRTIAPALTEAMASAHPNVSVRWIDGAGHDGIARAVLSDPPLTTEVVAFMGLGP